MTDPIQPLIYSADAATYDGDDWDGGYLQGLIDAQNALDGHAVVKLPEPRIMSARELADLDPGAGHEIWLGPLHEWYVQGDVIVNDFGHSLDANTLRREAAAMLAAAHALESKENAR